MLNPGSYLAYAAHPPACPPSVRPSARPPARMWSLITPHLIPNTPTTPEPVASLRGSLNRIVKDGYRTKNEKITRAYHGCFDK